MGDLFESDDRKVCFNGLCLDRQGICCCFFCFFLFCFFLLFLTHWRKVFTHSIIVETRLF